MTPRDRLSASSKLLGQKGRVEAVTEQQLRDLSLNPDSDTENFKQDDRVQKRSRKPTAKKLSQTNMAPSNAKRVKGVSIYRPFVYGTTAKPFDPVKNPKPDGTPSEHTHSWTVFVKGVDDQDVTYWLKKVQFKLHESIPNPLRNIEAVPGQPFTVSETGWGEFEIQIKLHYVADSGEKPQTIWHNLRLHPYGTEEEKAKQAVTEVQAWCYEEQIFNEPFEALYEILTGGEPKAGGKSGKSSAARNKKDGDKRIATVPARQTPGQPFSRETEVLQLRKLREAQGKVDEQIKSQKEVLKEKEDYVNKLKAEMGMS